MVGLRSLADILDESTSILDRVRYSLMVHYQGLFGWAMSDGSHSLMGYLVLGLSSIAPQMYGTMLHNHVRSEELHGVRTQDGSYSGVVRLASALVPTTIRIQAISSDGVGVVLSAGYLSGLVSRVPLSLRLSP